MMHAGILEGWRTKVEAGRPILGAGVGSGRAAREVEAGGGDLVVVDHSGRLEGGGGSSAGLLAYGNANQIVRETAPEVLAAVSRTPVLAAVCGADPFLLRPHGLQELIGLGFAGVLNSPTVGLIDGRFRAHLESAGMGYLREVECLAEAHALGLLTIAYVFDPEQARGMAEAGADALIVHLGLKGERSEATATDWPSPACADAINRICGAARSHRPDLLLFCHGGPLGRPEHVAWILERCPEVVGFYDDACSWERRAAGDAGIAASLRAFAAAGSAAFHRGAGAGPRSACATRSDDGFQEVGAAAAGAVPRRKPTWD